MHKQIHVSMPSLVKIGLGIEDITKMLCAIQDNKIALSFTAAASWSHCSDSTENFSVNLPHLSLIHI